MYSAKNSDMDFRLKLDFHSFKNASEIEREAQIFSLILRSLVLLKDKDVKGVEALYAKIIDVGLQAGWA